MGKKLSKPSAVFVSLLLLAPTMASPQVNPTPLESIAKDLGWVPERHNRCGGYYLEAPFSYTSNVTDNDRVEISSDQALFSVHGTSISQGKVTITRNGQQIIANKAYIYRDPVTGKIDGIDLLNNVSLREPNELVVARKGHYDLKTHYKTLDDILYRAAIYTNMKERPTQFTREELASEHRVTHLSAWGQAKSFSQEKPNVYDFKEVSYSTCPPNYMMWQVKASKIELNRDTGRGTARNAKIMIERIPVFYMPILNFPIDHRRQTGFLAPTFGVTGKLGPYINAPYYLNLGPNYDSTVTPGYSGKHGIMINDLSRYLTPKSSGELHIGLIPNDVALSAFQLAEQEKFQSSTDPQVQGNLNLLENASKARAAFDWVHRARFNDEWSGHIDYNYVTDDYYLRDFGGNNLNQVTQNQLLQLADINYQSQHWDLTGRLQGYQTLHPVDEPTFYANQYTRLPQIILNGDYPDRALGLDYFIGNDLTHFDIRNNPGQGPRPIGNRINVQPGVSLPLSWPYLNVTPRLQYEFTNYELGHVQTSNQKSIDRSLPIFDIDAGLYMDRNVGIFDHPYTQTLEPRAYYTYIPYRNQSSIPIFDTTVNTLTYDQLFTYNRFSSVDRINDANQVSLGIETRLIDEQTGTEKMLAGIGQIVYFQKRQVTLCDDSTCPDNQATPTDTQLQSPISGVLNYALNPNWTLHSDTIYNVKNTRVDNESMTLQFKPRSEHVIDVGYSYVRYGDILPGDSPGDSASNLRQTFVAFSWPVTHDWNAVGRWSQNWNHKHFQDFLYGLQYDSCCWAMRFVAGRAFTGLNTNNTYQYNSQFYIQFALKGLGNVGSADPTHFLTSNVAGYDTDFGRDF